MRSLSGSSFPGSFRYTLCFVYLNQSDFYWCHNELAISANVDDMFYGKLTAVVADHEGETEVELEEVFIETLVLGHGLAVKGGRFFTGIGYLNQQHPHA
ncbi:MAG: hypothetical protein KZQ81_19300 [Candidatus Thiodiazotropha sp. (ex Rostrolucina anterorostrata)]|nr:hypothetical protein [Candidatus Thiodiazotropha sp. (ex Rostrolucina anterorostrata)]